MIHKNKYKKEENIVQFISQAELDFHIVDHFDEFEIEKMLNEFLEDCHIQRLQNVIIIVGKGFVIRPYVKKLLGQNKFVEEFKQASYFNGQSGAFEVNLKSS